LLNPHLIDFTFLPIGVVGVDFGNDGVAHTIGTLSGARTLPQFGNVKVSTTEHRTIDNLE